jgi:hypothetical protein
MLTDFWKWVSIRFHCHQWEVHEERPLRVFATGDPSKTVATGTEYVLRCKVCGELKFKDTINR